MPKCEQIERNDKNRPFAYLYNCECGKTISLYFDNRPKRLIKCFNCLETIDLDVR